MSSEKPETVKPETRKPRDKAAENECKSLECSQEFILNHSSVTLEQNKPTLCSSEIATCRPDSFLFLKFAIKKNTLENLKKPIHIENSSS